MDLGGQGEGKALGGVGGGREGGRNQNTLY